MQGSLLRELELRLAASKEMYQYVETAETYGGGSTCADPARSTGTFQNSGALKQMTHIRALLIVGTSTKLTPNLQKQPPAFLTAAAGLQITANLSAAQELRCQDFHVAKDPQRTNCLFAI